MKEIIDEYGTRILGYLTVLAGGIQTLTTTGSFQGLLSDPAIRWTGIVTGLFTLVFGGATIVRGSSNAAQIKVASAIETAIRSTPGEE